jgi:hypothetical protein
LWQHFALLVRCTPCFCGLAVGDPARLLSLTNSE